jgi:hypothetical protein
MIGRMWQRWRNRDGPKPRPKAATTSWEPLVDPHWWDDIEPWGPARTTVSGGYARLHSRVHGDPDRLHTLFVDHPEKLAAQERFAPEGFQCGHFFAADPAGARSEAEHYGVDASARFLLEVELELPDVLDLANYEVLGEWLSKNLDQRYISGRPFEGLLTVIDQTSGGNALTDHIGTQAFVDGYRGVRFFGARAVSDRDLEEMRNTWSIVFGDEEERMCASFRRKPAVTNLVVFTAANVVRHTRAYRVADGPWRENPLFGATEAEYVSACERDGIPPSAAPDPRDFMQLAPSPETGWFKTNSKRPPR